MSSKDLMTRIECGRTDLVFDWLELAHEPDVLDRQGGELLRWAAYYGDVAAIRALESFGVALRALGENFDLNGAAFHGHWQLCEFLLERGADVSHADSATGETALHSALSNDDRARYDLVMDVLLEAGADPNARARDGAPTGAFMRAARTRGETPLHRAALFGSRETIARLTSAGAQREATDAFGDTPLAWASWARRPTEVLRELLFGEYRIHPGHRPLRVNLLGTPMRGKTPDRP